jgi:hypothetical protein
LFSKGAGRDGTGWGGKGREARTHDPQKVDQLLCTALQLPLITSTKVSVRSALLQYSCHEPQGGMKVPALWAALALLMGATSRESSPVRGL